MPRGSRHPAGTVAKHTCPVTTTGSRSNVTKVLGKPHWGPESRGRSSHVWSQEAAARMQPSLGARADAATPPCRPPGRRSHVPAGHTSRARCSLVSTGGTQRRTGGEKGYRGFTSSSLTRGCIPTKEKDYPRSLSRPCPQTQSSPL